jgi:hypothetical protein
VKTKLWIKEAVVNNAREVESSIIHRWSIERNANQFGVEPTISLELWTLSCIGKHQNATLERFLRTTTYVNTFFGMGIRLKYCKSPRTAKAECSFRLVIYSMILSLFKFIFLVLNYILY